MDLLFCIACQTARSSSSVRKVMPLPTFLAFTKDAGYAWVVLICSSMFNFFGIGFLFGAIGVLTFEYIEEFDVDEIQSSLVGSVLIAVLFLSGPMAAYIIGKLGVQKTAIIASLIHVTAFAVSGAATKIWHVIVSFSLLSGFAVCCCHVCTMRILTVWFDRHRHLSYAASALGSDLAAVAFPFITAEIIQNTSRYLYGVLSVTAVLTPILACPLSFIQPTTTSVTANEDTTPHQAQDVDVKLLADQTSTQLELVEPDTSVTDQSESSQANGRAEIAASENVQEKLITTNIESPADIVYRDTTEETTPEDGAHTLSDHMALLTTPVIIVFLINCSLWNMGGSVVAVLAYTFYKDTEHGDVAANLAMTLFGVGSLVGSLSIAVISARYTCNKFYFHLFSNLLMGVSVLFLPILSYSATAMTVFLTVLGFSYGFICANLGAVIEHLNGSRLLYLAYSYEMATAGIGSLIGPVAGSYIQSKFGLGSQFYFAAASILAAFLLFVFYAVINRSVLRSLPVASESVTST